MESSLAQPRGRQQQQKGGGVHRPQVPLDAPPRVQAWLPREGGDPGPTAELMAPVGRLCRWAGWQGTRSWAGRPAVLGLQRLSRDCLLQGAKPSCAEPGNGLRSQQWDAVSSVPQHRRPQEAAFPLTPAMESVCELCTNRGKQLQPVFTAVSGPSNL